MKLFKNQEKGVSLIIVFLIMIICFSVTFGVSVILVDQIKIMNDMGNSVRAIYLADSGIEKTLYYDRSSTIIAKASESLGATATRGICYAGCGSALGTNYASSYLNFAQNGCNIGSCSDCKITFNGNLPGTLPNSDSFTMKITISSVSTSTESFFQSTGAYGGVSRLIELDVLK